MEFNSLYFNYQSAKTCSKFLLLLLICFSCNRNSVTINEFPKKHRKEEKLILKAELVASYANYSNPKDKNYYYLINVKLINQTNKDCNFYTLLCGSLINIVTDSRQINFLYHNCSVDLASLIKLQPEQIYSIDAILLRNKYVSTFNPSVRFGFIISKPKSGSFTNNEIVSCLKQMREKQENVIWSDPVILTMTNSMTYEIRNIINDSTYTIVQ